MLFRLPFFGILQYLDFRALLIGNEARIIASCAFLGFPVCSEIELDVNRAHGVGSNYDCKTAPLKISLSEIIVSRSLHP